MTLIPNSASVASQSTAELASASAAPTTATVQATPDMSTDSSATNSSSFSSSSFGDGDGDGGTSSGDLDPNADVVQLTADASSPEVDTAETELGAFAAGPESSSSAPSTTQGAAAPNAREQSTAALVELSGASSITVDAYLISVPPNMAAATALVNELSNSGDISFAARSSVYTLLDPDAALALTAS